MPSQRHNVVVSLILLCVGFARGQTTPNALNPCANPSSYLPNLMLDPANNITCAVAAALYLTPFTGTDISTVQCSFLPNYPTNCCNTVKMIVGYLAGTVGCCFGGTGTNYTPAPCIETYPCVFTSNASSNPCVVGGYNNHSLVQTPQYTAAVCNYCYNQTTTSTWDQGCVGVAEECVNITGSTSDPVSQVAQCPFVDSTVVCAQSNCSFNTVPVRPVCLQLACQHCWNVTMLSAGGVPSLDVPLCSQLLGEGFCNSMPRTRPTRAAIAAAVQPLLDELATEFNTSISFGYADGVDPSVSFGLAAGLDDRCLGATPSDACTPTPLLNTTQIPCGSITKAITGVAILQQIDMGHLDLGTLAHTVIDPVFQLFYNSSMAQMWGSPTVNLITIESLLRMTAALNDYNDNFMEAYTLSNPCLDITPWQYIERVNKTLLGTPPNAPAYYSSINFVLLGYVLVGLNAVDSWDAYDQSSVIPAAFRSDYAGGWSFPNHGRCSAHPGVAHQYAGAFTGAADIASLIAPNDVGQLDIFDLYNFSCANGWTMGNVASSGLNLAMFFRDVYSGHPDRQIISPALVRKMSVFRPLTNTWCPGCGYGLASFNLGYQNYRVIAAPDTLMGPSPESWFYVDGYGHIGQDWGSGVRMCWYFAEGYDFAICTPTNSLGSLNSSSSITDLGAIPLYGNTLLNAVFSTFGATLTNRMGLADGPSTAVNFLSEYPMCSICANNSACAGWQECTSTAELSTPACAQFNEGADATQGITASFCVQKCPQCVVGAQSMCATESPPTGPPTDPPTNLPVPVDPSVSKSHDNTGGVLWGVVSAVAVVVLVLFIFFGVRSFRKAIIARSNRRFRALENPAFVHANDADDDDDTGPDFVDSSPINVYEDQEV